MPRSRAGRVTRRAPSARPRVDRRLNPASLNDRTLVNRAIEHSGLSTVQFGAEVLRVSARTIFRYLAGDSPLRPLDRQFLVEYVSRPLTPSESI